MTLLINVSSVHRCVRLMFCMFMSVALAGCGDNQQDATPTAPRLTGLSIQGAKTSLNPAFEPEIFRYSVLADDPNLGISLTALAQAPVIISVNGRLISSGAVELISPLSPGDTIQIMAENRNALTTAPVVYEVIYLPADFPEFNVSVLAPGVSTDPLYVNLNGQNANYVAIVNNHGVPSFYQKDTQRVFDFKWHAATGERSFARFTGALNQWGRRESEIVILDNDFSEVDRVTTIGLNHTDVHDFLILPNSELLFLSYHGSLRDLTSYGLSAQELIEDSVIQIVDRNAGTVLFEWNSWDQIPYDDQTWPTDRGEYVHVNSAFLDADDNIILSLRGTSQVVKLSRPGGQVLWKLGGKSNQFSFINDPFSQLCGQHTASRLENGNLLIFDNGQNCWPIEPSRGDLTRVAEYRLDEQALQAELVWSYSQAGAYTTSQGSAQRLPNGNTLIGWGRGPGLIASEVTTAGTKVFEIIATDNGVPAVGYRALRFPE
jgi:hypothetical protein